MKRGMKERGRRSQKEIKRRGRRVREDRREERDWERRRGRNEGSRNREEKEESEEEGRKGRMRGERGRECLGRRGVSKILRECRASNGRPPPPISRPQLTTDHSICLLSLGNRGNGSDI